MTSAMSPRALPDRYRLRRCVVFEDDQSSNRFTRSFDRVINEIFEGKGVNA